MRNLGYASPVLAFAAVLAALLGPTRHDGESGLGAVTPFGWAVIVIAALSLVASVVQVRQQTDEARQAREAADAAEMKAASLEAATNRLLAPGVAGLRRVLDFAFLLAHLDDPSDPRTIGPTASGPDIAERDRPARDLRSLPLDSERRLHGLRSFNYLPLRSFEIDVETRLLTGRADVLRPDDPHGTGVPFATDTRPFPEIVATELDRAGRALREAIEAPGFSAFDHEVLELTNHLLDHRVLGDAIAFPEAIRRFLAIEDMSDEAAADIGIEISLVIDSGISVGVEADDYLDFARTLTRLETKLAR